MKTILLEENNGRRLHITKTISKYFNIPIMEANSYTKSGSITLSDEQCRDLAKLLDEYSIKYLIQDPVKQFCDDSNTDEFLVKEVAKSGICKVGSVYILTQEAFDKFVKYKQITNQMSSILNELNILNNE